jgi:Family of unknown function (DUF6399)/IclR helix-turn-helix domain
MLLNIRERSEKVLQSLCNQAKQSLRAIASATGIPKSSVHRHLKAIDRRQQYAESHLWETKAGGDWLRILVIGVIYCFGIKGGIGSDSLSEFFQLLHLESRIGCSASALRELEVQLKAQIIAYGQAQASGFQSEQPIGICVGGDETFYGLPILVAIELASGFIFSEAECENRTYETWWKQVSQWFDPVQWDCRYFVSDGAKALVKLGLCGLGCPSLPDVFHLLYALSKSMGTAIARQRLQLQKQQQTLQAKLKKATSPDIMAAVVAQITTLEHQQQSLETEHQDYQQSLQALSQAIHPFDINTSEPQLGLDLPKHLHTPLATLERLGQTHAPYKTQDALERWKRQLPDLSAILHAWWQWTLQALGTQTQDPDTQQWVLMVLLPWVYWHQQAQKTRHPKLKERYLNAAQLAQKRFQDDEFTRSLQQAQQQIWIDWAIWMCDKFQRTSSAVEGRNGYLSRLHHANRGFTEQTLKALTVIHNFDLKRHDGSTAAQRLFGKPFPVLFDWVVLNMGELPCPRKSKKSRISKKHTLQAVPS